MQIIDTSPIINYADHNLANIIVIIIARSAYCEIREVYGRQSRRNWRKSSCKTMFVHVIKRLKTKMTILLCIVFIPLYLIFIFPNLLYFWYLSDMRFVQTTAFFRSLIAWKTRARTHSSLLPVPVQYYVQTHTAHRRLARKWANSNSSAN